MANQSIWASLDKLLSVSLVKKKKRGAGSPKKPGSFKMKIAFF